MIRRLSAILIILGGLALIIVPVVENVWTGSAPAKAMISSFKPVMTTASLQVIQTDLQQLGAANQQLTTQAIPALAGQLHMTPAQLQQAMATNFKSVATGLTQLPTILAHFDNYGTLLQGQLANYQAAAAMPVSGVPMTVMPWGFLLAGILAVAFGVGMLMTKGRGPAIAAIVLGAAILVSSLAFSFPHKAVSADHMMTGLRPVMSEQSVAGMGQALGVVNAMVGQMETQMFPYVAKQLNMTPQAFSSFMGTQFPAVGTVLTGMPSTMAVFDGMHSKLATNISNYQKASQIPSMTFLVWMLVTVGAIGLLGGLAGVASKEAKDTGKDHGSPTSPRSETTSV